MWAIFSVLTEIEGILGNSDFCVSVKSECQRSGQSSLISWDFLISSFPNVTNSEPGSGLILFDNVVIPFVDKYPTDTKTYRIMNTKPEESVQKEDAV